VKTRFRLAFAAVIAVGTLGTLSACGAHHGTGSITPGGTYHGIRYCSYTPTSSGIKISHYEHTPCVVKDTRTTKERKAVHTHTSTFTHSSSTKTPKSSTKKTISRSTGTKKH